MSYVKLKVKIKIGLSKIWYNKECIHRSIITEYVKVNIKNKDNIAMKVKRYSEIMLVKREIISLYSVLNKYNRDLYKQYWEVRQHYSIVEWEEIIYGIGEKYIIKLKIEKTK